jgi:hypothetical protein
MPKPTIELSSADLAEVKYPNPNISDKSKIDFDRKVTTDCKNVGTWSDMYPHEAALAILCFPVLFSMFECCADSLSKSSIPDSYKIDHAIYVGLLVSLVFLPVTAPIAVAVGGSKLLYDGCLFGKNKIEKYLEYSALENECRQSPNYK